MFSGKCLQQFKATSSSTHNSPCNQASRWRAESIQVPSNSGIPQEVDGRFKAHLLKGGTIGFHANAIKRFILSIIRHVICYQ